MIVKRFRAGKGLGLTLHAWPKVDATLNKNKIPPVPKFNKALLSLIVITRLGDELKEFPGQKRKIVKPNKACFLSLLHFIKPEARKFWAHSSSITLTLEISS